MQKYKSLAIPQGTNDQSCNFKDEKAWLSYAAEMPAHDLLYYTWDTVPAHDNMSRQHHFENSPSPGFYRQRACKIGSQLRRHVSASSHYSETNFRRTH